MWSEFDKRVKKLFRLVNGKRVVVWGYSHSGFFVEHIFKRVNREIEYIIDDSPMAHCKLRISRSFIIKNLDSDTHVILLTFKKDSKVITFLEDCGYVEGKSFIFLKALFYEEEPETSRKISYYDWLEYWYKVDILKMKGLQELHIPSKDSLYYSAGIDYALMDVCDKFVFEEGDAVFDFGCGKGGALLLFSKAGNMIYGGVEYDNELYRIACANYKKLNVENVELINGDASNITIELDKYNFFYTYNPFQGKTFENVIENLEESYRRKKRKITFIYNGPHCHDIVIKNEFFKLSKEIYTDSSVRYVNVYTIND